MAVREDNYLLGSGDLYIGQVKNIATATKDEIDASLVNVGAISGGAVLTYTPTLYNVESANRGTIASFKTHEEVIFRTGILTWNLKNLEKLSAAYYSHNFETGERRIGIGGAENIPINYVRFVHTKEDGKKLTVNIFKAQAQSGFELTFDKEQETVIDAEFKALSVPEKKDGNMVEIIEEGEILPKPEVESITPETIEAGSQPTSITIHGSGFAPESVVFLDKYMYKPELVTTYVSSTELTAKIDGLEAGNNIIKVKNGDVESESHATLVVS